MLYRDMRLILYIFLIVCWTFLLLAPMNVLAEDKTFTCEPVVAGHPKHGGFYVEDIHDESTPMLDVIPTNQLLLRGEAENVYFKNNSSREFEVLVPYERISDIKEIRDIHEGLSSWDEILSFENFRTYYLRYIGDNGSESLKRISINEKNTKTAILTVPMDDFPSYFSLFECKSDSAKEPIQVDPSDNPFKKIS